MNIPGEQGSGGQGDALSALRNPIEAAWVAPQHVRHRLDASFFAPQYLELDEALNHNHGAQVTSLRHFLKSPRRVLYRNTETYEAHKAPPGSLPFISGVDMDSASLSLNWRNPTFVEAWMGEKYPKGLIFPGALLIKVKGPNQLASYVEEVRRMALVSGTIFFSGTKNIDPYYLVAFLCSSFGTSWRTRLRTNVTVEFVNSEELKELPVVVPKCETQTAIGNLLRKSERLRALADNAVDRFNNWMACAALTSSFEPEYQTFLAQTPDNTIWDSVWIQPAELIERLDPWPHHVAPRTVRNHLVHRIHPKCFSEFFRIETPRRRRKHLKGVSPNEFHISILDVDHDGHIDWAAAGANRYDSPGLEVQPGDVLFSCLNPKETRVCVIPEAFMGLAVASPEFAVLRLNDGVRTPFLLAAILRSEWVRVQTSFLTRSSSLSRRRLDERDLPLLLLPWRAEESEELNSGLGFAVAARDEAIELARAAIQQIADLIAGRCDESSLISKSADIEKWLASNPSPYSHK